MPELVSRRPSVLLSLPDGGRTWWAHFEFTRINIESTILRKKIEDRHNLGAFLVPIHGTWSHEVSSIDSSRQTPARSLVDRSWSSNILIT
jgi:hypothetical protein